MKRKIDWTTIIVTAINAIAKVAMAFIIFYPH